MPPATSATPRISSIGRSGIPVEASESVSVASEAGGWAAGGAGFGLVPGGADDVGGPGGNGR